MRMAFVGLVLLTSLAATGCKTPVPRGKFRLPQDSFMTVKRIEKLVQPGMPIEQAREVMEIHGFSCTFEESLGIPHLQCIQLKKLNLWPFDGEWMATIYYENGLVTAVQARFDENPVEPGVCIPKRTARKARQLDREKDAQQLNAPPPGPMPHLIETTVEPAMPAEVLPAAPTSEELAPATVPVEIP